MRIVSLKGSGTPLRVPCPCRAAARFRPSPRGYRIDKGRLSRRTAPGWQGIFGRCIVAPTGGGLPMEMQQVRYFVALARTLNFTRAAEQSNVSQPALTRAIQQLEHELGGPLFHRERANTHLSELGRMMLPYLEQIHAQTEAAKQHAKSIKKLDNVTLRIGAMCTIGPAMIADLIVKFRMAHPNVDLEVVEEGTPELMDMLTRGDLNLALFGLPEPLDVRFHGLPLFQERFV